jgi:GNAT superfamily N-acetyltransferase
MTEVRPADPAEYPTVRSICNAAMLAFEDRTLETGTPLVAREDGRILGALLLEGTTIEAIAVRPNRRGQGVGSALVCAAADRRPRLDAAFDPDVRPFYEALGFEITCSAGRCRGRLVADER